jgi:hypothetical protein
LLSQNKTYYIKAEYVSGDTCGWAANQMGPLFETFETNQENCSQGGLSADGGDDTNTVAVWTASDDIRAPGPHTLTLTYICTNAFISLADSNISFTLPPTESLSATLVLESMDVSNAPAGTLNYTAQGGTATYPSVGITNFPPFQNIPFPSVTTGSNVATIVPGQSLMTIAGSNGIAPMSGELVLQVSNSLCVGTNLSLTLDVIGSYDFDDQEMDLTQAVWDCDLPTITPILNSPSLLAGNFHFLFQSIYLQKYTVQTSPTLESSTWQNLTNFFGDGSVLEIANPPTNNQMFYRITSPD